MRVSRQAIWRQTLAEASGRLNAYRAAKYLGISQNAFSGWVYRYEIPSEVGEGGKPEYRIADLDVAKQRWNAAIRAHTLSLRWSGEDREPNPARRTPEHE